MAYWRDWTLMNRLHCTRSQLLAEPLEDLWVFQAFASGEAEAREAMRQEKPSNAPQPTPHR